MGSLYNIMVRGPGLTTARPGGIFPPGSLLDYHRTRCTVGIFSRGLELQSIRFSSRGREGFFPAGARGSPGLAWHPRSPCPHAPRQRRRSPSSAPRWGCRSVGVRRVGARPPARRGRTGCRAGDARGSCARGHSRHCRGSPPAPEPVHAALDAQVPVAGGGAAVVAHTLRVAPWAPPGLYHVGHRVLPPPALHAARGELPPALILGQLRGRLHRRHPWAAPQDRPPDR
jgi:hypothetical protein